MTWRVEGMFCPHCEQTILGALSMFCFSLGTVPLMLGVGLISGTLNRRFAGPMRIACTALVAVMGMSMLQNALSLAGFAAPAAVQPESTEDGVAYFSDGVQLVHTTLDYRSYAPITVKAGIPVRWTITANSRVLNGCNESFGRYEASRGSVHPGRNRHISVFLLDGHDPLFHYR